MKHFVTDILSKLFQYHYYRNNHSFQNNLMPLLVRCCVLGDVISNDLYEYIELYIESFFWVDVFVKLFMLIKFPPFDFLF